MAEEKETLTISQDSPEAEGVELPQFKELRKGKTLEIPKKSEEKADEPTKEELKAETKEEEKTEEAKGDEEKAKRPKHDPKKRIEKLTRDNYEKDDEIERLRAENERLKSGKKEEAKDSAKSSDDDPEPELEKGGFKTYEDWVKAHNRWSARQEVKAAEAKRAEQSQSTKLKEVFDAHMGRVNAAKEKYEDFIEVVQNLNNPEYDVPDAVAQTLTLAIPQLEHSAEVMYALGNDTDLCKRLAKMTPLRAVAAMGKLNDSFDEPPAKSEKKTEKKLPEPIKPVGSGSGKSALDPSEMSLADYKKARAEGRI